MKATPRLRLVVFSFLLVFALLLTMFVAAPAMAQAESDQFHEYYDQMFSDLQSLIYTNPYAYATFFDNDEYMPNVTVITDKGWEFTGYQDLITGHIISYDWDRLVVYDRDGNLVFRIIVEP